MRESPRGIAPTAIVLGITTNGLSFVRSLGRRGTPVLMMDTPGGKPAMTSRFGTSLPMPDICAAPESWLSQLGDIARQASCPPVLIPTGDEHVLFVSQYRDELRQRFRFRIPPAGVAEMLCNKRRQYQFLIERGVLLPRTAFVDGEVDVARLAQDSVGFPCVLKPCFSHRWWRQRTGVKLEIARGADELQRAYRRMSATGESLLLQEFIPGDDRAFHGYLGYYGAAGRPLAALTKQKLRQYPPLCGNGSLQISTRNRRVAELSEYILRGLNYEGLVAIEYKLDRRDGQVQAHRDQSAQRCGKSASHRLRRGFSLHRLRGRDRCPHRAGRGLPGWREMAAPGVGCPGTAGRAPGRPAFRGGVADVASRRPLSGDVQRSRSLAVRVVCRFNRAAGARSTPAAVRGLLGRCSGRGQRHRGVPSWCPNAAAIAVDLVSSLCRISCSAILES